MKKASLCSWGALAAAALFVLVQPASATLTVLDDFNDGTFSILTTKGPTNVGVPMSSGNIAASAIGGYRDVI